MSFTLSPLLDAGFLQLAATFEKEKNDAVAAEAICSRIRATYPKVQWVAEKFLPILQHTQNSHELLTVARSCFLLSHFEEHPLNGRETKECLKELKTNLIITLRELKISTSCQELQQSNSKYLTQNLKLLLDQVATQKRSLKTSNKQRQFARVYQNALTVDACVQTVNALAKTKTVKASTIYVNAAEKVVVKRATEFDNQVEKLTQQLMRVSLSYACVPSQEVAHDECLFYTSRTYESLLTKPHVPFLILHSIKPAMRQRLFANLDFESQCALHWMLELQPIDHHANNIGLSISKNEPLAKYLDCSCQVGTARLSLNNLLLSYLSDEQPPQALVTLEQEAKSLTAAELFGTKEEASRIQWEIVFFDNEKLFFSSNNALMYTVKSYRFHIIAVRFDLLLQYHNARLSKPIIEELLDAKREKALLDFLKSPKKRKPKSVDRYIPAQLLEKSLRCKPEIIAALEERLKGRREYLELCKKIPLEFPQCYTFFRKFIKSASCPVPSSLKATIINALDDMANKPLSEEIKVGLSKIYRQLHGYLKPTFDNVACSMYPLLSDTKVLLEAVNWHNHAYLGDYRYPYELLLYRYFSGRDVNRLFTKELQEIREILEMKTLCEYPISSLEKLYKQMKQSGVIFPYALEVEHIFDATRPGKPDFFMSIGDFSFTFG